MANTLDVNLIPKYVVMRSRMSSKFALTSLAQLTGLSNTIGSKLVADPGVTSSIPATFFRLIMKHFQLIQDGLVSLTSESILYARSTG